MASNQARSVSQLSAMPVSADARLHAHSRRWPACDWRSRRPVDPSPAESRSQNARAVLIAVSSSPRTYFAIPMPRSRKRRIGQTTSCPGPWKVTSPPRSVSMIGALSARSTCSRPASATLCIDRVVFQQQHDSRARSRRQPSATASAARRRRARARPGRGARSGQSASVPDLALRSLRRRRWPALTRYFSSFPFV